MMYLRDDSNNVMLQRDDALLSTHWDHMKIILNSVEELWSNTSNK